MKSYRKAGPTVFPEDPAFVSGPLDDSPGLPRGPTRDFPRNFPRDSPRDFDFPGNSFPEKQFHIIPSACRYLPVKSYPVRRPIESGSGALKQDDKFPNFDRR